MVNNMHPRPKFMKDKKDPSELEIENYMKRLDEKCI